MDEDTITSNMVRRLSSRTPKVATQMVAALASSGNRTQGFGSVVEKEEFPEDFDKYLRTELNWSRLEDAVDETHIASLVFWC